MRAVFILFAVGLTCSTRLLSVPQVNLTPFEPGFGTCYDNADKFVHPTEVVAPRYTYPAEMLQAGILGEVVALVTLDIEGNPATIAILYDVHSDSKALPGLYFAKAVVDGLKHAKWIEPKKLGVWFYVKVRFEIAEEGDSLPQEKDMVIGVVKPGKSMIDGTKPNKALVPTVMSVTPAADAPVAPATTAAHL